MESVNSQAVGLTALWGGEKKFHKKCGGMATGFATPKKGGSMGDSVVPSVSADCPFITLFLPAAGNRNGASFNNVGSNGNYWSSSVNETNPNNARRLNFNSGYADVNNNNRYNGFTVRAVRRALTCSMNIHNE